ncbi:ribosome maturation factor RimM [Solibacillus sp. FSL W7-1472]|uniref:Ribosome maturation factor RimM n=1 Tax=Solibacillus isronensis B3W22 TaxID=1224748 RepID=K1LRU6_9BACL|nr:MULTISPECIES: ribosome maturation factor RimM [Solibacillus]AMO84667.1 ribosome maturation factor RimM [Solibacillus silvestris]EKB46894.1 Ribosome maturation factor rimM [Solibacillus isronensis B3W22]OBW58545.1 ribosome maturation factor RimM [Solibacillus silvestris]
MEWFNVGRIVNTHGIRGELRILSTTDFEEERFAVGSKLAAFKKDDKKPTWVTISSSRRHKNFILVTFEGMENINLVEPFKEGLLKVSMDQLAEDELEDNEYYHFEIKDCEVFSEEGELIGVVTDILETGANDVWEVKAQNGKKHYIPYIEDIVKDIDVDEKKIIIHVMEGLLE